MASSLIDSLLQTPAPPRATDPPRGPDRRGTFAPVLDEALQADSREQARQPALAGDSNQADDGAVEHVEAASADGERPDAENEIDFEDAATDDAVADEQSSQAAAGTEGGVAADEDDVDDDEDIGDEPVSDVVEISAAAAVVVEAEIAAPLAPITTPVGDVVAPDAHIAKVEAAPTQAEPNAIEIGNVWEKAPRGIGEAPSPMKSHKAAAAAAAAKAASDTDKSDMPVALETAGVATAKPARGKAVVDAPLPQNAEEQSEASGEIVHRATEAIDAVDSSGGEQASRVKPSAVATAQQRDAAVTIFADPAGSPPAARSDATDASTGPTTVAAPAVAPTGGSGDAGAIARSAAALARLAADRSTHTATTNGEEIDRARFVGRVEGAIRTAQQRDGRVQVRLSPPELGALRIELTMQHGVLSARLEAETPAARNLLLDNLPALRERLAQQDVRIDRFDVDVRRDGGGSAGSGQQQNGAQDRQAQDPLWRQALQRPDRGVAATKLPAPSRRNGPTTDAALDVRV